jgi:hypothetical protein
MMDKCSVAPVMIPGMMLEYVGSGFFSGVRYRSRNTTNGITLGFD